MDNRNIIIGIVAVILILLIVGAISYAYYSDKVNKAECLAFDTLQGGQNLNSGTWGAENLGFWSEQTSSDEANTERFVSGNKFTIDNTYWVDDSYNQLDNGIAFPFGTKINDRYQNPYIDATNQLAISTINGSEVEEVPRTTIEAMQHQPANNVLFKNGYYAEGPERITGRANVKGEIRFQQ